MFLGESISSCFHISYAPVLKFSFQVLEMKEAWQRHRDSSNTSAGFIVQAGALWRGTPARELEPIATHRLGLDIGG
jgi:hypothetical protein